MASMFGQAGARASNPESAMTTHARKKRWDNDTLWKGALKLVTLTISCFRNPIHRIQAKGIPTRADSGYSPYTRPVGSVSPLDISSISLPLAILSSQSSGRQDPNLCQVCASIDLKEEFTLISRNYPNRPVILQFAPPILHFGRYADMEAAAASCQLCALVVRTFNSRGSSSIPAADKVIYRSGSPAKVGHKTANTMNFHICEPGGSVELSSVEIELYVCEDNPLAKRGLVLGRPISLPENNPLPLQWINECLRTHRRCKLNVRNIENQLPARLLEVGVQGSSNVYLRDGRRCSGRYATLSYCWGKSPFTITTKASLHSHMKGFDISTLCKTMYDAVIITRSLGLRYIWIDALCIVQDNHQDWQREAMAMAQIYTRSFITIAATSSTNGDSGCFHAPPLGPTAKLKWTLDGTSSAQKVGFREYNRRKFSEHVNRGPLNQRAWVVQERCLSPRTIHYTNGGLFWECQEATLAEGNTALLHDEDEYHTIRGVMGFQLAAFGQLDAFGQPLQRNIRSLLKTWLLLVERYTICQLTYESDRLPALSGLAKVWARAVWSRYIVGVWVETLPLDLLWTTGKRTMDISKANERIRPPLPVPSWSWCSLHGPVSYFICHSGRREIGGFEDAVEDLTVTVDGSDMEPNYGYVENVTLELSGRIKWVVLNREGADKKPGAYFPWSMGSKKVETWPVGLDVCFDGDPIFDTPIPILHLCFTTGDIIEEFMLLMQQLSKKDQYRRIGLGHRYYFTGTLNELQRKSWFEESPKERISIV